MRRSMVWKAALRGALAIGGKTCARLARSALGSLKALALMLGAIGLLGLSVGGPMLLGMLSVMIALGELGLLDQKMQAGWLRGAEGLALMAAWAAISLGIAIRGWRLSRKDLIEKGRLDASLPPEERLRQVIWSRWFWLFGGWSEKKGGDGAMLLAVSLEVWSTIGWVVAAELAIRIWGLPKAMRSSVARRAAKSAGIGWVERLAAEAPEDFVARLEAKELEERSGPGKKAGRKPL